MERMLLTPRAVLLELNLRLDLLLVALRKVIDVLTNAARETDEIILGHTEAFLT